MTRQTARKTEGATAEPRTTPDTGTGQTAPTARSLDPLISALSRAVDRQEGTAG